MNVPGLATTADRSRTGHADTKVRLAEQRAAALAEMARIGALTGAEVTLPATSETLIRRAGIGETMASGNSDAWQAWWDQFPTIATGQSEGLGLAGQAAFADARKKKLAAGAGRGGRGSVAPTYSQADRQAAEEQRIMDLHRGRLEAIGRGIYKGVSNTGYRGGGRMGGAY